MAQFRYINGDKSPLGVLKSVPRDNSRIVMEGFQPGSYAFHLSPIHYGGDNARTYVLPVEFRVQLRPGETVEKEVALTMGGRLKIWSMDFVEGQVELKLLDSRGRAIPFQLGDGKATIRHRRRAAGHSIVRTVLSPGSYLLVVTGAGAESSTHSVQIHAGKTTDLFSPF